jgi:Ca2+-binding EF-hand superfamily protein
MPLTPEERTLELARDPNAATETSGAARDSGSRDVLRAMTYEEGQAALSPEQGGGGTFLHELFVRMDQNKDNGINRDEVKAHLKAVGVDGGIFGIVHSTASKKMIKELDQNKDKVVSWGEFQGVAKTVLPEDVFDEQGQVRPELVDEVYAIMDKDKSGGVSSKELYEATLEQLPAATSNKKIVADIGAKSGMDALDFDKSGDLSKDEILRAAHDIARAMGN